ncbi:MAG: TlpA family protein disulfide reductase, partial [Gemmataceae bacterium]
MRCAKLGGLAILVGVMSLTATISAQPAADKIAARPIKYPDLGKLVRSHRGKVIVVDFWRLDCIPCKREFPHLVELNEKYSSDGLVAMSVSLDDADDKTARAKVDKFLKEKQATFTNLISQGDPDDWFNALKIGSIPCVFVFDRDNRRVKKLVGEQVDYKAIEA